MLDPVFLYVEDDPLSRKVMLTLVTKVLKFQQITIWEDSTNFIERAQLLNPIPNVIFLDVQLRPHDGYEMLRMLRTLPAYNDSSVIAMTANVMSHDVEKLQKTGFNGLIGKPLMKDIFPQLIEKILQGQPIWFVP